MWGFVFPGQGSQHVGMGRFLYDDFRSSQLLFEEASDAVGVNFKKLCFEGPESELTLTAQTQPALLLISQALYQAIQEVAGLRPHLAAGHSLGEYSACVASGAVSFADGIRTVRQRGQFMQEAVPVGQGGMAAVLGLEDSEVRILCQWASAESKLGPLEPANYNCPGQVVISGSAKTLNWLSTQDLGSVLPKKPKLIPLNVSAPFHSSLMKSAQEKMAFVLRALPLRNPEFPIVQNVTAEKTSGVEDLRQNLIEQISAPVRWTESLQRMKQEGVDRILECGPGKVLAGLAKKIDRELVSFNIQSIDDLRSLEKLARENS